MCGRKNTIIKVIEFELKIGFVSNKQNYLKFSKELFLFFMSDMYIFCSLSFAPKYLLLHFFLEIESLCFSVHIQLFFKKLLE